MILTLSMIFLTADWADVGVGHSQNAKGNKLYYTCDKELILLLL